jgi:hypothetical protein
VGQARAVLDAKLAFVECYTAVVEQLKEIVKEYADESTLAGATVRGHELLLHGKESEIGEGLLLLPMVLLTLSAVE